MEVLQHGHDLLVHQTTLCNCVDINGLRLSLIRERRDVTDSIEPPDPLLDLLGSPRDAVEDKHPRALEIEANLNALRREEDLCGATLKILEVLDGLVAEGRKIFRGLNFLPLADAGGH